MLLGVELGGSIDETSGWFGGRLHLAYETVRICCMWQSFFPSKYGAALSSSMITHGSLIFRLQDGHCNGRPPAPPLLMPDAEKGPS